MEPKIQRVGKVDINYYESSGTGPAVVMVHGNSFSALSFERQVESTLGRRYRVIAVDLPGHGRSGKAHDPETAYSIPGYADALGSFAAELGVEDAVYVGWSLGGHVVMEAGTGLASARGLMVFGAPPAGFPPPIETAYLPNPAFAHYFTPDLSDACVSSIASSIFSSDTVVAPEFFREDIRRTDPVVRPSLGSCISSGNYKDEIEIVAGLDVKLAVLHGGLDRLVNSSYYESLEMPTLWKGEVQVIEGAGHALHWEQAGGFNALLGDFIEDCNR